MHIMSSHVLILAAGKGTRMKSSLPKVLHGVAGRPMIEYVLDAAGAVSPASCTVVVGHEAAMVQRALGGREGLRFLLQEPQLGTGHALLQAEPLFRGMRGTLVLLSGDVPLLSVATLRALTARHAESGAAATVVTAIVDDPAGYGRIVREEGRVTRIVEHRDASPDVRAVREINSGIYAFDLEPLFPALARIGSGNAQGEYYLTDLVALYSGEGRTVSSLVVPDVHEVLGINSRIELAATGRRVWQARNDALMASGVTVEDPATTYVGHAVVVGTDTVLRPGVVLEGTTRIGRGCVLFPGVRIEDSEIGDQVTVYDHSLISGARIAAGVQVGPFARLRPETVVDERAHIGNFVELKKTHLGAGSKASHLAYLGDATIGVGVNIGAGTITCNYDGVRKNPTVIGDRAFIGSDSQLIAPVKVGSDAYVAAGSSITDDVPSGSLAIARGRQVVKEGWVKRKTEVRRQETEGAGETAGRKAEPKPHG
jgi:bifunctional UDP-N-acetylglucosamine pyrophosphorylase / glucosamine-1-phosphate N-acetyltransferase